MKQIIRWTSIERDRLVTSATSLMRTGKYRMLEAFRQAQNTAIDTDRHRNIQTLQILGDLPKLVQKELLKPESYAVPDTQPSIADIAPTTLDSLVQTIATHIAQILKTEVTKVVTELEHEFKVKRHNPECESNNAYGHRPKIVVIGLLPHQEHSMSTEFPQYAFYFMSTEYAIRAKVIEADAYLLMKNFIKHAVYEKYKKDPRHVLIDGGMTALRAWLTTKGAEL